MSSDILPLIISCKDYNSGVNIDVMKVTILLIMEVIYLMDHLNICFRYWLRLLVLHIMMSSYCPIWFRGMYSDIAYLYVCNHITGMWSRFVITFISCNTSSWR